MRQREAYCSVLLPAEVYDDQDILESGIVPRQGEGVSFICGWNFVTRLYRILEYLDGRMKLRNMRERVPIDEVSHLFTQSINGSPGSEPSAREVLDTIQRLYETLPVELKSTRPMSGDITVDRYGFRGRFYGSPTLYREYDRADDMALAANVVITMTTVKMVLAGSEAHTVNRRCAIAGELLDGLSTIPTSYIQASSTPMVSSTYKTTKCIKLT